jgi:diaminohydroxyphosphoribosylaminopyrimidine deaminase/5-amino-6-(5-phosphoribosylamino)uracil reductase
VDEQFMARALELAQRGRFSVSPNPMVGCVVVRDGEVIGEGFHQRAGMAHAEVEALRSCRVSAMGATVYTNLEPCNHTGRTPPCTEVLRAAGVQRVVIGIQDPHPRVDGRGLQALQEAGIEVTVNVLREEAEKLNERFLFAARSKRPFTLVKAGMTLDGKLATVDRDSRWITSEAAREKSLELREEYDAIMVGSGTVVSDDPQLTRRLGWNSSITPWLRVVLDARDEVPPTARLLQDGQPTLLIRGRTSGFADQGNVEVVTLPVRDGKFDLQEVLMLLGSRSVQSLIVEGGSMLLTDMIQRRLWQKVILFVAPLLVGGRDAPSIFSGDGIRRLADAHRLRFDHVEPVGEDLMVVAYPG